MVFRITLSLLMFCSFMIADGGSMVVESRETMTIESIASAEYTVYKKIVVNDEIGKDLADISIWTSDYVKLKSVKATIFDGEGKREGRYKKKHFSKQKSNSAGIIGSDNISYEINLGVVTSLPFTMEIEYTKVINSLFFWPDWSPQEDIPVIMASYTLEVPPAYGFNSFSPADLLYKSPSENTYVWSQLAIPAWPDEIAIPPQVYDRHRVFFTPDTFKMDKYAGSMSTWQSMADFYGELAHTQYVLDPELVSDLKIDSAFTLWDTISQIYEYVQKTTRYVGIELGVHGWKPHSSQWVCENKYGDCKDLSTFFISLLQMHHIEAYPVLILTRHAGVNYPEFPNNRFNHAIACVPVHGDTLWVDCTYDEASIDLLPRNDQGCHVLVIKPNDAMMIQTPTLPPETNQFNFDGQIQLGATGFASLEGTMTLIGVKANEFRSAMRNNTLKEQRESVISMFRESAPGFELETYQLMNLESNILPLAISLKGNIPHLGGKTGKRYFANIALPGGVPWTGEHPSRRTMPFNAGSPSIYASHIVLSYDDAFSIESLPAPVSLDTPYGSYTQEYSKNESTIEMNFEFKDVKPFISLEDYETYYQFRQASMKAGSAQVVFLKN